MTNIWASTRMPNVAYKPTSRRIFRKTGEKASAAEDVNDLRPLRGALPRVIDILLASAPSRNVQKTGRTEKWTLAAHRRGFEASAKRCLATAPFSIALHPAGRLAYVANS